MSFNVQVANAVTADTLENFLAARAPEDILQHVSNKPLLTMLERGQKEFKSAGPAVGTTSPANLREAVHGALMAYKPAAYAGISGNDTLVFNSSDGEIQTQCPVRWMHAGFIITHEELMYQGVEIVNNKASSTPQDRTNLLDALELRKADYMEAIYYNRNRTLWLDGTQDGKAIADIKSIITDDPTIGTCVGISRATNTWWRHVARTGVGGALPKAAYSKENQTLTETVIADHRTLTTYGGNPDVWLAGSDFVNAMERETRAKGQNSVTGWTDKKTGILLNGIKVGNYEIVYDPTLDQIGEAKRCYAWDSNHLRLRPQAKQWGKVTQQNQPSDQFVMLLSTTDRGALTVNQLDCCYVVEIE